MKDSITFNNQGYLPKMYLNNNRFYSFDKCLCYFCFVISAYFEYWESFTFKFLK